MTLRLRTTLAFLCTLSAIPAIAAAQSLDLTVNDVGLSIGDARRVTGLRINFRDRRMQEVNGINITVWQPYSENRGVVNGLALGVPLTGAQRITGVGAGIFGVAANESIHGLGIGGIGIGAGQDIEGIGIGGIGMGVGRDVHGIAIGGIGMGIGEDLRGIGIGGIGMGIGRDLKGAAIGGIGLGLGGDLVGLGLGGIGVGVGGNARGILVTGIGAGVGGDMTGVSIAGVGMGVGGTLKYLGVAGIGIGAHRIEGLAVAPGIGAEQTRGMMVAPFYFKILKHGSMKGASISAYNDIHGTQQGLAIGIFNYARTLDGVQIGVLNYAANKRRARLLPLFNYANGERTGEH